jgi:hypothetical protein
MFVCLKCLKRARVSKERSLVIVIAAVECLYWRNVYVFVRGLVLPLWDPYKTHGFHHFVQMCVYHESKK